MGETVTESLDEVAAGIPEGAADPCLDALLCGWPRLASFAWEAYRRCGRGVVLVAPETEPLELIYLPAMSCPAPGELLKGYDPATQVVVAIGRCPVHAVWLGAVSGWPAPFEAWCTLPAAVQGETLQ